MSRTYRFVTVDVFTATRFGGNPLAVFPDARGLSGAEMQAMAREFNLAETTFVLPPDDPANAACIRIFTPAAELPFAGHPNVGTGYVLARLGPGETAARVPATGPLRFEEIAGLVEVVVDRDAGGIATGATIAAPQPLTLGATLPAADMAACASLTEADVVTVVHPPILASVGNPFVLVQMTAGALTRATPDPAAFRAAWDAHGVAVPRLSTYLYAREGDRVRARLFAPALGISEDPATGSAATSLAALLLSISGRDEARLEMVQGVEMGRPSLLRTLARRTPDGIRAWVGGECVPVLRGEAEV